jgi:hypothetical protein
MGETPPSLKRLELVNEEEQEFEKFEEEENSRQSCNSL